MRLPSLRMARVTTAPGSTGSEPSPRTGPATLAERAQGLRDRLLPRTIVGVTMLVLAASLGAALSGTILFAYYQYRLNAAQQRINSYVSGFGKRFDTAVSTINADRNNATAQIQHSLAPLIKSQAQGQTMQAMLAKTSPSVWLVHTLDANGQPSVGSAFAVATSSSSTLLLTSYSTVQAATKQPAPTVFARQNGSDHVVHVQTWQQSADLALLVLPEGNQPVLHFASGGPALAVGDQLFAVSGLGAGGGSISAGQVAGLASNMIETTTPIGAAFQGGPLLDSKGRVVGVASLSYAPAGFTSSGVWLGVPIKYACQQVLSCPSGSPSG